MSDLETNANQETTAAPMTAGRMLRAAREATGVHIAALAVAMKVPVKKLEALEADRAHLLLDAVFVRALAASMCRTLKTDPAPVLELLPKTGSPNFESGEKGINAPFRHAGERRSNGLDGIFRRPTVFIVLALLLSALAVLFVPELHWEDVTSITGDVPGATVSVKESAPETTAAEKTDDRLVPVEVVPGPAKFEPPAAPPSAAVAAPPPAPPVPAATPGTSSKAPDMVSIRAKEETWVEVVDATGTVLLRRIIPAQGVASATGAAPLAVVVGRADATEIEVRGRPFNISAFSKENVARFEVK